MIYENLIRQGNIDADFFWHSKPSLSLSTLWNFQRVQRVWVAILDPD
jgi:hypothetical protein